MLMFVEFDVSADIIDVPETVANNKEHLKIDFLKWLCNHKHKYRKNVNGHTGLCYRSEAFVDWLNTTVLEQSEEKATVVEQYVSIKNDKKLPSVLF